MEGQGGGTGEGVGGVKCQPCYLIPCLLLHLQHPLIPGPAGLMSRLSSKGRIPAVPIILHLSFNALPVYPHTELNVPSEPLNNFSLNYTL